MSWTKRQSTAERPHGELQDEDVGTQPLLTNSGDVRTESYGSVDTGSSSLERPSRRHSPEMHRRESLLNRVPEEQSTEGVLAESPEDAEEIQWDLEEQGFYAGSYRRTVMMYTFVPLISLLLLAFLARCPDMFWPIPNAKPIPHPSYFPSPIPELLLSSALWSLGYLLRMPIYTVVSFLTRRLSPFVTTFVFHLIYAIVYNLLRISSSPILRLRTLMDHPRPVWTDPVFRTVWWLSLGWAAIDVAVGIIQSYSQIALYRNVMVPEDRIAQILAQAYGSRTDLISQSEEILPLSPRCEGNSNGSFQPPASWGVSDDTRAQPQKASYSKPLSADEAIGLAVDQDLEQLANLKERQDLEEIYGFPVIKIPVFVSCLQRIDSILLSTGNTLVLSAAYLHSSLSFSPSSSASFNNRPILITFPLVLLINWVLSVMHTPLILPRIGVQTTAYIGLLFGLGSFFAGLGYWGALA
ncbi:hypothetical protein PHLCEN_2v11143 [Hermanssonia centrifuga]|uniref:Uncharacterized protein n=1 Tax=Hermanssonia centrifuga TaxID=98765 RepID=A0A2R6NKY2_9APHY|nr:hypothetical protein PHLCEN_2v11143 [Hermanssonia centrifuga]